LIETGTVKKYGFLKIVHEKYKTARKEPDEDMKELALSLHTAIENNPDIKALIPRIQV